MPFETAAETRTLLARLRTTETPAQVAAVLDDLRTAAERARPSLYELELALAAAGDLSPVTQQVWPYNAVRLCKEVLEDPEHSEDVRFLALVIALTRARRLRDARTARELLDQFGGDFTRFPLLWHFKALSFEWRTAEELEEGLATARRAVEELPGHPGAAHAVASFLADLAAAGRASRQDLEEALRCVETAIGSRPDRARFYYTRARLRRHLAVEDPRCWSQARRDVLIAIEKEDLSAFDGPQRLRDYQLELALIDQGQAIDGQMRTIVAEQQERLTQALQQQQVRVIEALAFFTAVIAIIFQGVQLSTDRPVPETIAVVFASALVVFLALAGAAWVWHWSLRSHGDAARVRDDE